MTSDPYRALALLRGLFIYRPDGPMDVWHVLREVKGGRLRGDCEDFALALAWLLAGRSWWRFVWHLVSCKSVIWHCTTVSGVGHAVLWHRGTGWADNISPYWRPHTVHRRRFPWLFPLVGLKLSLAPVFAWVNGMIKRAKDNRNVQ